MVTISICMIVKNEEKVLARCLESLKGLAEEIIIVDTGSTDATKEIALEYTDKVYDFEWIDDFSAARNFSFQKASMQYIYVADADEVLEYAEHERFLHLKRTLDPSVEIVQMLYTNQLEFGTTYNYDEELRPKLYRRIREFKWQGAVHEMVRLEPVILDTDIRVKHVPVSAHSERDFSMFLKAIWREGDLSKHLTGMYARELMISGTERDFEQAMPCVKKKLEQTSGETILKQSLCVLAHSARIVGDTELFFQCALKNVALEKASSEICFELGEYYRSKNNIYEALIWYYNAIYETEPDLNLTMSGSRPAGRLAECHEQLGNIEDAKQYRKLEEEFLQARK